MADGWISRLFGRFFSCAILGQHSVGVGRIGGGEGVRGRFNEPKDTVEVVMT